MKKDKANTVPSNALRHMIQAECGSRRYSDEEWWHIDRQLPPYCQADSVPWSQREPVFRKITERILFSHDQTYRLPAARVIVAAAKYILRPKLNTAAVSAAQVPAGRPATAQEASLLLRAWAAHGAEYAGELATWMETGPHDYADLEQKLPANQDADALSATTRSMQWTFSPNNEKH
tara:strand:+ start:55 stop:585 length:531 start_codon:yes stop_codon:yes gene_type:complete